MTAFSRSYVAIEALDVGAFFSMAIWRFSSSSPSPSRDTHGSGRRDYLRVTRTSTPDAERD